MNHKEYNNSVYFIHVEQNKLIEYNLLSKKKVIHYITESTVNYHISKNHKIIIDSSNFNYTIAWNGKLIEDYYAVGDHIYFIGNHVCIYRTSEKVVSVHNLDGKKKYLRNINNFVASGNAIFFTNRTWYKYNPSVCMEQFLNIKWPIKRKIIGHSVKDFVKDSYFLIFGNSYRNSRKIIYNITTENKRTYPYNVDFHQFFANDILLFHYHNNTLSIYNANDLLWIRSIVCYDQLVMFHKQLGVLVATNFNCYTLNNNYDLNKINLGINYFVDSQYSKNHNITMRIILELNDVLLFDYIPHDVTYIVLYQQMNQ